MYVWYIKDIGELETSDVEAKGAAGARQTHIQIVQTVPAEGVFAALAQHLRTALVPLDIDATHRTLLNGGVRVDPVH